MHLFDMDIACSPAEEGQFQANISGNWSINATPNGGYLMAIVTQAMQQSTEKTATSVITVSYLSRCKPGPVTVMVEKTASSTQFDRLLVRLFQDGALKLLATGLFTRITDECTMIRYESRPPVLSSRDKAIRIPNISSYTVYDHMEIRLDPECCGWMQGKDLSKKSEHRGWIRFDPERPFDLPAITLAADAFPPPILASQGIVAWVPTLEFSVNVRNLPKSKWLKCVFRTRYINCGLLEEDGEIWDEGNELVAVSRQIAQFRPIPAA